MGAGTSTAIARRSTYEAAAKQELFIVPLIRHACESAIMDEAARTRSGSARRPPCAIDVGCGNQPLRLFVESAGYRYESLDVSQNAVGNVDHLGALDDELPSTLARGQRFDLVICTEVLEHVADWNRAFGNLASLASPGARIVITCPHVYPMHEQPHDYWRATEHAIRAYAERHGLRVVELTRLGTGVEVLGTVLFSLRFTSRSNGLMGALRARFWKQMLRLVKRAIAGGSLQRSLDASGDLYLSNFAVLGKK